MRRVLQVSEIFGPTIQGEGRHTGQSSVFLRLGGCNLNCWWCDTPYTWAFGNRASLSQTTATWDQSKEIETMPYDEVQSRLRRLNNGSSRLIITGGEPLLQARSIAEMLVEDSILLEFTGVDVETAGTIPPIDNLSLYYTVSPKLSSSLNSRLKRYRPEVLEEYLKLAVAEDRADFKFVVGSRNDEEELLIIVRDLGIPPEYVWVMPEGATTQSTIDGLTRAVKFALDHGFNVSTRLHVLVWGAKRGV